jgi:hypothetical protein
MNVAMPQTEIEKINFKLDQLGSDVTKILGYLYNDDRTSTKGLIQQVREVRADVDGLLENNKISLAKKTVLYSVLAAIGGTVIWVLKTIGEFIVK